MVADIMKSLTVYNFDPNKAKNKITEIGRYPKGQWCLEMAEISENFYLISDFDMNVSLLQANTDTKILNTNASYYMGEQVNCITKGFFKGASATSNEIFKTES